MEVIKIPTFQILFISLLFIFTVLRTVRKKKSAKKLPPGPWKLPLIGNIHHLITSHPHRRLTDLARIHGPVMHLQLGEITNIVISAPETAKEVMKTHDISFAGRPRLLGMAITSYNFTDIAFAPYGDYWRQMRKICTVELLTAKRVDSFRPVRQEQVSKLIRNLSCGAGAPLNFSRLLTSLTYSIVSTTAFGKTWDGEQTVVPAIRDLIDAVGGFSLADLYPSLKFLLQVFNGSISKVKRHQEKIDKLFQSIIDEHRARRAAGRNRPAESNEDLMDVLLNIQEQGDLQFPLTDDNIKAVMLDIFGGGTETSSTILEWTMAELIKNPRVMKMVQEEVRRVFSKEGNVHESCLDKLKYLKLVIKEVLRLHPPFPLLLPRESREECSIYEYEIPVKSKVIVNAWAMGRDPSYWTEAEKFYPERFIDSSIDYKGNNFELIPFGSGRRMCPGLTFGMASVEYPLAQLLFHFDWKLPTGITPENLDMLEVFGIVVKRKNELHLIPIPYHSSNVN